MFAKKNISKFATVSIAAAVLLSLPFAAAADASKPTIGFAMYGMPSWVAWGKRGAEKVALANNADLQWVSANMNVDTQLTQIQQFIDRKVDVIIVGAVNSSKLQPALEAAKKAGIPVVGVNMSIPAPADTLLTSYIGPDDVQAGRQVAKQIIDALGGKGNVVVLQGPIGQSAEVDRSAGIKDALSKAPGIKLLAMESGKWDRTASFNITKEWLARFGTEINGIIAENDDMAIGAAQALKKAEGLYGKIPVAGVDGIKDGMREIEAGGMIGTNLQNAAIQLGEAVQVSVDIVQGKPHPKKGLLRMLPVNKDNLKAVNDQLYVNPDQFLNGLPDLVKKNLKSGDLAAQ